nr:barstar family protein [Clostridia bacterium]
NMINRIIKREELTFDSKYYEDNAFQIIIIDGHSIIDKTAFFREMELKFQFPGTCKNKFSRFDDWMTDLSWLPEHQGICIVINNYANFLSQDPSFKRNVMNDFEENILPFWEEKVLKCVKDGKQRQFDIILN